ncbi:hypothetical protein V5799_016615 [Amblyomma americanum]|uniref:Uncharacterized protein n=1 Tax=Amblyomma americanum TaxID=6943 RepID=A0AAQ4F5B1_AMBAM
MMFKKLLTSCFRYVSKLKDYGVTTNPTPPYEFMCQVGDPVLRARAEPVDPVKVTSAEVQKHSVIFYLVILLHNVDSKVPSLVPLLQNTMPRLDALKMVYRGIHDTSWSLQQ